VKNIPEDQEPKSLGEAEALAMADAAASSDRNRLSRQEIIYRVFGAEATQNDVRLRTLLRRLSNAVEWGWLQRQGDSRATTYSATPEFMHVMAMRHIAKPQMLRQKVSYNEDFLAAYEPNKTFYLSDQQRQSLHKLCPPGSFNCKDPAQAQQMRRFMTDLTHHSALLEGVRAKYIDTIQLLEDNIQSKHLSTDEAVTLRNHYNAARMLVMATGYPNDPRDFTVRTRDICQIHAVLSDGLLNDRRDQGRLRHHKVEIKYCQYIPLSIPDQIEVQFQQLIKKGAEIEDPFEQSFFLNAHLPYLQPFADCNKRVARVACNIPLLNKGVLPISWREVTMRDYHDALICLYERNSIHGMTEIFTQACLRSFERFDVEQKHRQPHRHEITYSREIEMIVRKNILEGDPQFRPRAIPDEHWPYVRSYVHAILESARDNDMVLAPYRIDLDEWHSWRERESDAPATERA